MLRRNLAPCHRISSAALVGALATSSLASLVCAIARSSTWHMRQAPVPTRVSVGTAPRSAANTVHLLSSQAQTPRTRAYAT